MATMLAYGFFGDIIQLSDKWRCLGPLRYDVAGVYQFICNRSYHCELTITQTTNDSSQTNHSQSDSQEPLTNNNLNTNGNKQTRRSSKVLGKIINPALELCKRNCEKCSSPRKNIPTEKHLQSDVKLGGRYTTINCLNMPCRTAKSKFGISPFVHLGKCSLYKIIRIQNSFY